MVYTAESDPLCYPGTTVLRNKLDLTDQSELDEFETTMFVLRSEELWPEGYLDVTHYLALHHHLFQDVYDWAGEICTIRIGKGGNWFYYPEFIAKELNRIFQELA
ncbi:Fic/DOC family protein [Rhizobium johnstonii]|uniref:Fic/DOC family protein n=1 Tax=Rhizobium TaxID=379 RepID=UPI002699D5ED